MFYKRLALIYLLPTICGLEIRHRLQVNSLFTKDKEKLMSYCSLSLDDSQAQECEMSINRLVHPNMF